MAKQKSVKSTYEEMGAIKIFKESDEDTAKSIVSRLGPALNESVNLSTKTLLNQYQTNLKQYLREPLEDDKKLKGKSKHVSADVQERVDLFTSQVISILDSQKSVVTFDPRNSKPESKAIAKQQNDVVQHVLRERNSHVSILTPWVKNSALFGLGVLYVGFDEQVEEGRLEIIKGVDDNALVAMVQEQEDGKIKIESRTDDYKAELPKELLEPLMQQAQAAGIDPAALMEQADALIPLVRDVGIRRIRRLPTFSFTAVAPEDFIISKDADFCPLTGGIRADIQGHRCYRSKSDLIENGYDKNLVEGIALAQDKTEEVALERTRKLNFSTGVSAMGNEVEVSEIYTCMAIDGKKKRHYRITLAGDISNNPTLLGYEEVSRFYPYAALVPYPLPNTLFGQGVADRTGREQELNTQVKRGYINNLHKIIDPVVVVNPEDTNPDDLLNMHPGKVVRSANPTGGVSYNSPPFVGDAALGLINMLSNQMDLTTGVGGQMMSMNPTDLQDVTATAVLERKNGQQMIIEQVVRHFADTGYRYVAKLIIDLCVGQPELAEAYITRLEGQFVPFTVDEWDSDMDVSTNISFGMMTKEHKNMTLMAFLQLQQQAATFGAANPQNLYSTLVDIAENMGIQDVQNRLTDPSTLPPPPPPPPSAEEQLVQVEKMKAELKAQADELKRQFEAYKMRLDDDFKRDKMAQDFALGAAEIESKYDAQVNKDWLTAEQNKQRTSVDWAIEQERAATTRRDQEIQMQQAQQAQAQQQQQMDAALLAEMQRTQNNGQF